MHWAHANVPQREQAAAALAPACAAHTPSAPSPAASTPASYSVAARALRRKLDHPGARREHHCVDSDDQSAPEDHHATRTLSVDVTQALASRIIAYARAHGLDVDAVVSIALASFVRERAAGQ